MTDIVLDSSAILALIFQERGADRVAATLSRAVMSSVNAAEVFGKHDEIQKSPAQFEAILTSGAVRLVTFSLDLARGTGGLRSATKHLGLSLGDRACLALALREGLPVMTADRHWTKLAIGVTIECIR